MLDFLFHIREVEAECILETQTNSSVLVVFKIRVGNFGMPCTPVHSGAERGKFASEVSNHLFVPGDRMGRLQNRQRINYDSWAVEWNEHYAEIESGLVECEKLYIARLQNNCSLTTTNSNSVPTLRLR